MFMVVRYSHNNVYNYNYCENHVIMFKVYTIDYNIMQILWLVVGLNVLPNNILYS